MADDLPGELIEKIRGEVENGRTKLQVSRDYGISYYRVKKHTKDLPRRRCKYTPEMIERIREMTREAENKTEVARRLGIPYMRVLEFTQDIKVKNVMLGQLTMDLLQDIVNNGYACLNGNDAGRIRHLRKHFPVIEVVKAKNRSIAFLPGHKDRAMRIILKMMNKRVWNYQELRAVTRLFDSDLTGREKRELVGVTSASDQGPVQHTLDEYE